MEQEIVLKKEGQGVAFLRSFIAKITPSFNKTKVLSSLKQTGITIVSILLFLALWQLGSKALYNKEANYKIEKALKERGEEAAAAERACIESGDSSCQPNTLPSPLQVWGSLQSLIADHKVITADKAAFVEKMADTNAKLIAQGKDAIVYTGRASFIDIVLTSIKTVFAGFLLALLIAVPIGIIIGLSPSLRSAFNWFIQVFKPVSPVVWYLLVFMIVKTLYIGDSSDNAFVISFISVGLCAMWATLVNTAMGVSSVDKDYINVAKVLKLGTFQKVFKVILPSSLPLIFTGLRITLSVAWMVLIAIELLAQSQGLGLFVWEEFQNGANDSNAKIIVAMFVIGIIGFLLDRIMLSVQNIVSFNKNEMA
ncbi:ABC transporter permease [Maribacter sp. MAR_2009_72]|uniref:ABC transporter permease n=1 Tax=Maribacter sp. MAR_2009_72 TaxID=1250050 RepID=UPI00119AAA34|nr:ABC transporter permease [Maribacter sp. MAR_2009_72]TVZ16070.1 nitrate/nitrite transport system permease protein [Maribacter sp. MAR_2009_72]